MFDQLALWSSIVTTHWQTLSKHAGRTSRALPSRDFRLRTAGSETETLYFGRRSGGNTAQRDLS